MNNITLKAQELQEEIAKALVFEEALNKKEGQLNQMQEDIKVQNIAQVKTIHDLSAYQSSVKRQEEALSEREKQISIKEKSIRLAEEALNSLKETLRQKEQEIITREEKLVRKEAEFSEWEGKIKLAEKDVEEQKILNQREEALDEMRKSKLRIKEQQIEAELTRLKGMAL